MHTHSLTALQRWRKPAFVSSPCRMPTGKRVDLRAVMNYLGEQQVDSVLLEGGGTLNGEALRLGLVHKVQAYIAPKLIGGASAHGPVGGPGIAKMADALQLADLTITRLGEDILIEGRIRKD